MLKQASTRKIGGLEVSSIGLGCMGLSNGYGTPPDEKTSARLLNTALDQGCTLFDTAALYGFGANESLIGRSLKSRRAEYTLASKCGMFKNSEGKREINGHPDVLRKTCEDSLQRLQTDVIDLYYLHRWDRNVAIEDSVGELSRMVEEGKLRYLGLSEVSAETLAKAHAVHPIAAVQTEYSLWTRNPEIEVLKACESLGVAFVAFSPLARAYLTGVLDNIEGLEANDLRRSMPRFQEENYRHNLDLLNPFLTEADELGCTPGQVALAWLLKKSDAIIPIPGTANIDHFIENMGAQGVELDTETFHRIDSLINQSNVCGPRYIASTQVEIDTEEFV